MTVNLFLTLVRPTYLKCNFKKPGKDGFGAYRAVLLSGPPGIGKTTSAHLCARLEGYTPIELNASDTRSKKLIEVCNINLSNESILKKVRMQQTLIILLSTAS
jgi:replication factor C subunit 1